MAQVGSKYQDWGRLKSVGSAISDITKTSSTFAHVEENRIFYLFQKKILYFPFQNLLLWIFCVENINISENDIIIVGIVKELWYEQYEPLCSYMQVSFFIVWNFALLQNLKKIVANPIFLKEKNLKYISTKSIKFENF
jgi:hypothetical protein